MLRRGARKNCETNFLSVLVKTHATRYKGFVKALSSLSKYHIRIIIKYYKMRPGLHYIIDELFSSLLPGYCYNFYIK